MSNKFVKKTVSAIAIAMLMISTFAVLSSVFAIGHPAISMWIDPAAINLDTGSVSPGYTFWVTVWLNATGGDIGGWQFKMLYPKAYLKALQCVYTGTGGAKSNFFENTGTSTYGVSPSINEYYDATRNYTMHGESWASGPHGTGLGSLSKVQFEVVAAPPKGGSIADLIDISTTFPADTYAIDWATGKINLLTAVYNCNYNYLWLQPPSPYLAVLPTSQTFGPYENVTGKLVDVSIYLNNLYAAWYLVNASFKFHYDPLLLEVNETNIDVSSWDVAGTATETTPGVIDFFVETSQVLSGGVKVVDMKFKIIFQGEYPMTNTSDLTFSDVVFSDHTMLIPAGTSLEGEIIIKGLLTLPLPHLEVVPASTVIGPEPSMGKEFTVNVDIKDLHVAWKLVGTNFRLSYDDTLLEVVSVTPGTFLDQTSWGKIALGTITVPQAEAPTWVGIVRLLLKVVTTRIGTYTFSITAPTGITVLINSLATTTFSVNSLSPPLVTFKLIEFRNYNVYPITGPYEIKVTPTTWGAEMAGTYDISLYWNPSVNKTVYPTWWSWLNGTKYANVTYPHHWDLMNWWVTEGSLKSITYAKINGWTNPAMYADSGNVAYQTFMNNTYMADPDLANPNNNPDIVTVIPWIRNVGVPPWSWFFSDVLPHNSLPAHVAVGTMLATDTGNWYIFPQGSGTLATIKFKVIKQAYVDLTCNLTLFDITMLDKDGEEIPYEDPINGKYTILAFSLPGRQIDLYTQYPAPYGGQGPNHPSDMFWPQKEVILYAYVTYNWGPQQQKLVAYEIVDPHGKVWDKKTAVTNAVGIAEVRFRMPWPCDNPESLFGIWNVTATVDIACIVVNDTLRFHYNYLVNIVKVTTDAIEYAHGDTVTISIQVTSLAMQTYSALVTAAIVDELGYSVGFATKVITVKGAVFCTPKTYTLTITITIPKFAAAGLATVHVNCFNKDPTEGGMALCPEFAPPPEIFIDPY